MVVRADVAAPLTEALEMSGVWLPEVLRWAAITVADGAPFPGTSPAGRNGGGCRCAASCGATPPSSWPATATPATSSTSDAEFYDLEPLPGGEPAVTTNFATTTPAVRYNVGPAEKVAAGCPEEPDAQRVRWL